MNSCKTWGKSFPSNPLCSITVFLKTKRADLSVNPFIVFGGAEGLESEYEVQSTEFRVEQNSFPIVFIDLNRCSVENLLARLCNSDEAAIAGPTPAETKVSARIVELPGQEVAEGNTPYWQGGIRIG